MSINLAQILSAQYSEDYTDNTYEEFVALKGVAWNEEKEVTGNESLSFEEYILTPYIDEALAL